MCELKIVTELLTALTTIASGAQATPAVAADEVHGGAAAASAGPAPVASAPASIGSASAARIHRRPRPIT